MHQGPHVHRATAHTIGSFTPMRFLVTVSTLPLHCRRPSRGATNLLDTIPDGAGNQPDRLRSHILLPGQTHFTCAFCSQIREQKAVGYPGYSWLS